MMHSMIIQFFKWCELIIDSNIDVKKKKFIADVSESAYDETLLEGRQLFIMVKLKWQTHAVI